MLLSFDQFNQLREHACTLHQSQTGAHPLPLDAVFGAVVAHAYRVERAGPGRPPVERTEPPVWFGEALTRLAGQSVTVSSFIMLAGQAPADQQTTRSVGRWLRDAGRIPRKVGGQQLFQI